MPDFAGRSEMGGGKMGGRGRFWRSGPVSEAPPLCIRTPQPLPEGLASDSFGGPIASVRPQNINRKCITIVRGPVPER